ncbi:MAG: hypothetical protein FWG81_01285, partial [Betaproteobacteria bacterium]|nr:hypothetical protein [Betaproteobacteria bacterium]
MGAINRAPTNDRKRLIPIHALLKSNLTIAQMAEAGKTSAGWRLASCRQQIANPNASVDVGVRYSSPQDTVLKSGQDVNVPLPLAGEGMRER